VHGDDGPGLEQPAGLDRPPGIDGEVAADGDEEHIDAAELPGLGRREPLTEVAEVAEDRSVERDPEDHHAPALRPAGLVVAGLQALVFGALVAPRAGGPHRLRRAADLPDRAVVGVVVADQDQVGLDRRSGVAKRSSEAVRFVGVEGHPGSRVAGGQEAGVAEEIQAHGAISCQTGSAIRFRISWGATSR
jgi:hypothetical protein